MRLQEQVKKTLNEKIWNPVSSSMDDTEIFYRQIIDKIHKLQFLVELLAKEIDEKKS